MCGIFGFFNPEKKRNVNADYAMPELLFANQLRGRDACGLFGAHQESPTHVDWIKMAGSADAFLEWKEPHVRFFKPAEDFKFMVAHNRAATIGAADDVKAAHPHVVGNITLVHNGTLSSYANKDDKFVSDSHFIAGALDEDADFLGVEKRLYGAYALVWHDARDQSLNFVRNHARPLSFVSTDDKVIWFASEPKMAEWILTRKNKRVAKVWDLAERLWIKILPDGQVIETDVPFYGPGSGKPERDISFDEYLATPECQRAQHTVITGRRDVKDWRDLASNGDAFDYGKGPPHPLAMPGDRHSPTFYNSGSQSSSTTPVVQPHATPANEGNGEDAKGNRRYIRLTNWRGFEVGHPITLYPTVWSHGIKSEQATNVIAMTIRGPMVCWVENAPWLEFVEGVKVHSRIHPKDLVGCKDWQEAFEKFHALECIWEATITSMNFDTVERIINIHAKDAEPNDWCNKDHMEFDDWTPHNAWIKPLPEKDAKLVEQGRINEVAAPEVAADGEKKPQRGSTRNGRGPGGSTNCACGAKPDQGLCFIPKGGQLPDCIFHESERVQPSVLLPSNNHPSDSGADASKTGNVSTGGRNQGTRNLPVPFTQKKSVFVQTGKPFSVRCENCHEFYPVWEHGVYVYHVAYHEPRKISTRPDSQPVSTERVNVCESCVPFFTRIYEDTATLSILGKHGYELKTESFS